MKIFTPKHAGICAGFVVSVLTVGAAMADDTELLLMNPDPSMNAKPNVMFILDTSGSMSTEESTTDPYDSSITYAGDCDVNSYYWSDVDLIPACASTTNIIDKWAFVCNYALLQLDGIGSYTDTMVQYNTRSGKSPDWIQLEPGDNADIVECQADSGKHGDGTAGDVYAATTGSTAFTSDPKKEISWGSAPRNLSYTVYDGNYLNWRNSPTTVLLSRIDIVKETTKKVLSSVDNMNVGLMRFNTADGGPVILGMTDLDTNRQAVMDTIDSLQAGGRTPLSETMYENALYWEGLPAYYGENINETPTDPGALISTGPEVYKQPPINACAKNYNVLLTDGEPVDDDETPTLAPTLPDFSGVLGRNECTFTMAGDCLDDITEYLSLKDLDSDEPGDQTVTTNTIGFTIDLPLLKDTAELSGGKYFLADDVESLTLSLLSIISNINDLSLSFSAPAVSVNTFNRTQNLNDLYLTMFGAKGNAHWPGNLKKYKITNRQITDANDNLAVDPNTGFFYDTALSYWTFGGDDGNDVRIGGAAQQLPDPAIRKLYTNNVSNDLTAAANAITPSNAGNFSLADFGLSGAVGEPTLDEMIRWSRGEDIRNEDGNLATTVRKAMGDPLHSQPAALIYGGTSASPDVVVFVATNDGYLHAVDGNTGQELWSFVPKELLPNFTRLYFDPRSKYKQYGIDGNLVSVVKDENKNGIIDGTDFVYLLFGLRRGGDTLYALDVTDKNNPQLLWNVQYPEFGQSWSTPVVTRMDINTNGVNADNAVVVVGGGYDPVHDTSANPSTPDSQGASVYILDLVTGAQLWKASSDAGADLSLSNMTRAIATQVRVIDLTGNGYADRMYASDMGGQVWRFDITNGQAPSTLVAGGVIAQVGAEGLATTPTAADTRRFYNAPDVSMFQDKALSRRFISVSIGSGYRAHPFDLTASDRFFSIRDPDVFNKLTQADYNSYDIVTDADLVEVSGKKQVALSLTDRGWKFTLPANQKVLADSVTFNNEVLFVSFTPDTVAAATCSTGQGTNFLYRVSVVNGDPIVNNLDSLDPADADLARSRTLQQGGIAPSPTILFPSPDDPNCTGEDCAPPPIGCVGVECFDPGFENNPVRTLWTQDGIQ